MRILAVSDLHGNLAPVRELVRHIAPDLLVSCGDWGDPGKVSASDLEELLGTVHVLTVYGNHDDIDLLASLKNRDGSDILLKNGQVIDFQWVRIAGISGIWAKSHTKPWYITDEEAIEAGRAAGEGGVELLVSHGCAIGLNDKLPGGRRGGQRCFLDAFQASGARIYICGHLHNLSSRTLKDGSLVANTGNGALGDHVLLEKGEAGWSLTTGKTTEIR